MRKPSSFMVTPIDVLSRDGFDYAYGVVTNGERMLIICTEGVSWEVTDERPWTVGNVEYTRDGIDSWINNEMPGVREPVSLDKWIRTFGERLESNFAQASWWLDENMGKTFATDGYSETYIEPEPESYVDVTYYRRTGRNY